MRIAVGSYHVLALTMDGAIWTFGLNRFGQVIITTFFFFITLKPRVE